MRNLKQLLVAVAMLLSLSLGAQTTREEYYNRYALLAGRLGVAGVGVETVLNKWEADFPEDKDMLVGKFNYYYTKSQSASVEQKDQEKFMGAEPVLSLQDSTGKTLNYFEEIIFDDDLYAQATTYIDKAIRLNPEDLNLRFYKLNAMMSYEKESPDMATVSLNSLIDYNYSAKPAWIYDQELVPSEFFAESIQEYCYTLYLIGSKASIASFKSISEKMSSYEPKNIAFLNNIGSYYLIAESDNKEAMKYYKKVLKIDPEDYSANKNSALICRKDGNVKQEIKYLQKLLKVSPTDAEKQSVQARLTFLSK